MFFIFFMTLFFFNIVHWVTLKLLHSAGFGLACHLGILADIPTIGVGKNVGYFTAVSTHKYNCRYPAVELFSMHCSCHQIQFLSVPLLSEDTDLNVSTA
jgi:hypothetical protein